MENLDSYRCPEYKILRIMKASTPYGTTKIVVQYKIYNLIWTHTLDSVGTSATRLKLATCIIPSDRVNIYPVFYKKFTSIESLNSFLILNELDAELFNFQQLKDYPPLYRLCIKNRRWEDNMIKQVFNLYRNFKSDYQVVNNE